MISKHLDFFVKFQHLLNHFFILLNSSFLLFPSFSLYLQENQQSVAEQEFQILFFNFHLPLHILLLFPKIHFHPNASFNHQFFDLRYFIVFVKFVQKNQELPFLFVSFFQLHEAIHLVYQYVFELLVNTLSWFFQQNNYHQLQLKIHLNALFNHQENNQLLTEVSLRFNLIFDQSLESLNLYFYILLSFILPILFG